MLNTKLLSAEDSNAAVYVKITQGIYDNLQVELANNEFLMGDIPVTDEVLTFSDSDADANKTYTMLDNTRITHIAVSESGLGADTLTVSPAVVYADEATLYYLTSKTIVLTSGVTSGIVFFDTNLVLPEGAAIVVSTSTSGVEDPTITAHILTVPAVV